GIPVYTPAQGDPLPAAELRAAIRRVGRVVAFASPEPVRELLAELHARRAETVHDVQTTAAAGGELQHHAQTAARGRVRARAGERHVHAAVGRERMRRGDPFRVEESAERVAAQVGERVELRVHVGDVEVRTDFLDGEDRHGLVEWALHVELDL